MIYRFFLRVVDVFVPAASFLNHRARMRPQAVSMIFLALSLVLDVWGHMESPIGSDVDWSISVVLHVGAISWANWEIYKWVRQMEHKQEVIISEKILAIQRGASIYFAFALLSMFLALLAERPLQAIENLFDILSIIFAFIFILMPPRKRIRDRIKDKIKQLTPSPAPSPA